MYVELGSQKIYVKVIYKNNRNLYFRFDENASLIVTCPKNTLDEEIIKLIKKNEKSLLKMYQRAIGAAQYEKEFWLLGKKYEVVLDENLNEVTLNGEYVYAQNEEQLNKYVQKTYEEVFAKEASICAKCFNNLPKYILKFRKMKTRWGVCNRKDNSITLNTELIKKTEDLIDYVIIHEMAHFYEGNHSKAFWNIVALACPDYKERRNRLRK